MTANSSLIININAKNNSAAAFRKARQDIGDLDTAAQQSGGQLGGLLDFYGGELGQIGARVAGAFAVGAIANTAVELARIGAQAERTSDSFGRLASQTGESSDQMLSAMRAASRGTVDDASLMLAANKAMASGVVDSVAEMSGLIEAALIKGRETGLPAAQAIDDLITGIARMSPEILDNLNIFGAAEAFDTYAQSLRKTSDQLTDVERKQALVNSVLSSTTGVSVADDAAASFERMESAIKNAQGVLGQLFSPAVAAIADQIASAVDNATTSIQAGERQDLQSQLFQIGGGLSASMDAYIASIERMQDAIRSGDTSAISSQGQQANVLMESMVVNANAYNEIADKLGQPLRIDIDALQRAEIAYLDVAAAVTDLSAANASLSPTITTVTQRLLEQATAAAQAVNAVRSSQSSSLRSAMLGEAGNMGGLNALAVYQDLNDQLAQRTTLMQNFGASAEQIEFSNQQWIDETIQSLHDQRQAYVDVGRAGVASAGEVGGAYNDLQSKIAGVISQSTTLDAGIDPTDYLPRADAINENARRLAAIVRDGIGNQEWLGEFAAEVPAIWTELTESGDPQRAAATILQQFEDGLRPELLDREQIKSRVRAMLLGDQSSAQLAQEIAQELSTELGVSLSAAQAAANSALGSAPGAQPQLGPDGAVEGSTFVERWTTTVNGQMSNFSAAGQQAGNAFGTAFVGVQNSYLQQWASALVGLVTSGVIAQMASQSSRTEAR